MSPIPRNHSPLPRPATVPVAPPTIETLLRRWIEAPPQPTLPPVGGFFYLVRLPAGWQVASFRYDEFSGEPGHADVWPGANGLAFYVARQWAAHLQTDIRVLYRALETCCYCFPRGRVSAKGKSFLVHHGKDFLPKMCVTRSRVERMFGITGQAKWQFDEHERCFESDSNEIRSLLTIREAWPACA